MSSTVQDAQLVRLLPSTEVAIGEACQMLVAAGGEAPDFAASMLRREAAANTFLGHGVTIPYRFVEDKDSFASTSILITDESRGLVLLVDDQIMVGEGIRRMLADQPNFDFHVCHDPHIALATAKRLKPTVILQDLVIQGADGLNLIRQYRADPVTSTIPVIVLSSREEPLIKSEAFKAGANDYLVKLPDKIELVARLRYHSRAYLNQLQRDQSYHALRESQRQLVEMNVELQRLSCIDALTGLSNRRYFDEYIDVEWKRATRSLSQLSLIMIDIDNFKQYNDIYGHIAGDEVLRKVANVIGDNCMRASDLAARFGGEEFCVVLPVTEQSGANLFAKKIRRNIEGLKLQHSGSDSSPYVTVSIGTMTSCPQAWQSYHELLDLADQALYEAKRTGRNRVVAQANGRQTSSSKNECFGMQVLN
jgi:two-component system, chemotaxis family, response regulator WspR